MTKIWRKNFEIKQVEYIMMTEVTESFFKFQKSTANKVCLNRMLSIFENGNAESYFYKDEIRTYVNNIIESIISDPKKIKNRLWRLGKFFLVLLRF